MDPKLVEQIVHEVKSQGVFDEFRRNSIADVDTKPAYQNLRQRVENTVKKFLSEQKWSPDVNKIQLRERLRKHITDSGFLDVGVERIVDQVVNPKVGSVFQPKIEDIAYKFLGVPKPTKLEGFNIWHQFPTFPMNGDQLKVDTSQLLPNDLEQISPDSDKATNKSDFRDDHIESESKVEEDDESPPFEPIENSVSIPAKEENLFKKDSGVEGPACSEYKEDFDFETRDTSSASQKTDEHDSDNRARLNLDAFHESHSQLSQVSSTSCLSVDTPNDRSDFTSKSREHAVNISEEAQMPQFSENSNEGNANRSAQNNELHFDIKQDEIKFEGTKRNLNLQPLEITSHLSDVTNKDESNLESSQGKNSLSDVHIGILQQKDSTSNESFKFTEICAGKELVEAHKTGLDTPLDALATAQTSFVEKIENTQSSFPNLDPSLTGKSEEKGSSLEIHRSPVPSCTEKSKETRHKKHSKKKSEKERNRDRERGKDKFKGRSESRHSSNTAKSRSSNKTSTFKGNEERPITEKSKHSSDSSHCKPPDDSKGIEEDLEKQLLLLSSKQKKIPEQPANQGDDHFALRDKNHRRKSTDSNDDDGRSDDAGGKANATFPDSAKDVSEERDKCGTEDRKSISSTTTNAGTSAEGSNSDARSHIKEAENVTSKIVILNEVLQNPTTDFIDLGTASQESGVRVTVHSEDKSEEIQLGGYNDNEEELYFFEENGEQFRQRLELIDNAIDQCRKVVNNLRFGSISPPMTKFSPIYNKCKRDLDCKTKAALHIDGIQHEKASHIMTDAEERTDNKRFKYRQSTTEVVSPTPSEASGNSKENELVSTDISGQLHDCSKQSFLLGEKKRSSRKQRYTTDDLYKPRLSLEHRVRRKDLLDTIV